MRADNLWKSAKEIIHNLTGCVSQGGNYLLNVGPTAEGVIPQKAVTTLHKIGEWLKLNGESIYGAKEAPFASGTAGVVTAKDKRYYLIIHWWPGEKLVLPSVKINISTAKILETGQQINLEWQGKRLILNNLPRTAPNLLSTVIVME